MPLIPVKNPSLSKEQALAAFTHGLAGRFVVGPTSYPRIDFIVRKNALIGAFVRLLEKDGTKVLKIGPMPPNFLLAMLFPGLLRWLFCRGFVKDIEGFARQHPALHDADISPESAILGGEGVAGFRFLPERRHRKLALIAAVVALGLHALAQPLGLADWQYQPYIPSVGFAALTGLAAFALSKLVGGTRTFSMVAVLVTSYLVAHLAAGSIWVTFESAVYAARTVGFAAQVAMIGVCGAIYQRLRLGSEGTTGAGAS